MKASELFKLKMLDRYTDLLLGIALVFEKISKFAAICSLNYTKAANRVLKEINNKLKEL